MQSFELLRIIILYRITQPMDIKALIEQAQRGNETALSTLYNRYYSKMLYISYRITECKEESEELAHDAFIIAFSQLGSLRNPYCFEQWLSSITTNLSLKLKKSKQQTILLPLSELNENNITENATDNEPSTVSIEDITTAINQLPEGYRTVFNMSVIQEMSHKEIAEILHIEAHSSSSQLARAKKMLKKILSQQGIICMVLILTAFAIYYLSKPNKRQEIIYTGQDENVIFAENDSISPIDSTNPAKKRNTNSNTIIHNFSVPVINENIAEAKQEKPHKQTNKQTNKQTEQIENTSTDESSTQPGNVLELKQDEYEKIIVTPKNKQLKWGVTLAYSSDFSNSMQSVNPISFHIDNIENTPDIDAPTIPSEISDWYSFIRYLHMSELPEEDKEPLIKIAEANIENGEYDIKRSTHHDLPITLEIDLQYRINEQWRLGTGISYTELNSQFITGMPQAGFIEKQKVQYIGIPVNCSYYLTGTKQWNLYISTGVTVEIPINATLSTDYILDASSFYNKNENLNAPLQFSGKIGVGLQYNITPNIGVFAEPSMQYYIPNGSDIETYRTEHPFVVTMPIGLKLTW